METNMKPDQNIIQPEAETTTLAEIIKKAVDEETRACAAEIEANWGHIATPELRDAITSRLDQRKESRP